MHSIAQPPLPPPVHAATNNGSTWVAAGAPGDVEGFVTLLMHGRRNVIQGLLHGHSSDSLPASQINPLGNNCCARAIFKELNEWDYKPPLDRPNNGFGGIGRTSSSPLVNHSPPHYAWQPLQTFGRLWRLNQCAPWGKPHGAWLLSLWALPLSLSLSLSLSFPAPLYPWLGSIPEPSPWLCNCCLPHPAPLLLIRLSSLPTLPSVLVPRNLCVSP